MECGDRSDFHPAMDPEFHTVPVQLYTGILLLSIPTVGETNTVQLLTVLLLLDLVLER